MICGRGETGGRVACVRGSDGSRGCGRSRAEALATPRAVPVALCHAPGWAHVSAASVQRTMMAWSFWC
eukprot:6751253-Prymnesium_polylepis.1